MISLARSMIESRRVLCQASIEHSLDGYLSKIKIEIPPQGAPFEGGLHSAVVDYMLMIMNTL